MATKAEISAEKAFSQAVEQSQTKADVVAPVAQAQVAEPAKAVEPVVKAKPAAPAKVVATVAKTKPVAPAKKIAARKPAAKKPVAKRKVAKPKALTPVEPKETPKMPKKTNPSFDPKAVVADIQKKSAEAVAEARKFTATAYAKGSKLVDEGSVLAKANAEALLDSGKIVAGGVKSLAQTNVESSRVAVAALGDDLKAASKLASPAALFEMQGKLAARNYDAMVAYATKTSSLIGDIAKQAFAPLSASAKSTVEAFKKAA